MTTLRSSDRLDIVSGMVRTVFEQTRDSFRQAIARRKTFRRTVAELSLLSDRSLHDLGIPRSSIKGLALEAANDR